MGYSLSSVVDKDRNMTPPEVVMREHLPTPLLTISLSKSLSGRKGTSGLPAPGFASELLSPCTRKG